jgi:hypothetical protein
MGGSRKAHPRLPLRPNSRARRGAWAGTKEPRPLGDWGTGVFITGWVRFVGIGVQRHPAPNQRPQAARRSGCSPTPAQSSVSLFAWLRFRACGDTQGGGQGGAGVQPTSLCASFNQRHDAERAPRQPQANAQRGSADQHADYDRIQLSVTVVDCRLLVPATRSRAAGGSMSLLRS